MLAAMKLGAVVIPATTLLRPGRPARPARPRRGAARGGRRGATPASSTTCPGDYTRIAVGGARRRAGCATRDADAAPAPFTPGRRRPAAADTAAALLHLRHHRAAEAGGAHARLVPGRPPVHDVLDRAASRATSTSTSPRRAGRSTPGATCSRRGSPRRRVLVVQLHRGSTPARLMDEMDRCGVTSFCAPPTVWRMLIQADLSRAGHPAAQGGRRRASRSTPR